MILRGIDFGMVWGASGVQGFTGEGYWYHKYLKFFGLDFAGMTLVTKTVTRYPRIGNIKLNDNWQPLELFPETIKIYPFKGLALNALGLSNPGIDKLLNSEKLRNHNKPFLISIALNGDNIKENLSQAGIITNLIYEHQSNFKSEFGLQINYSCPNVDKHDVNDEELGLILKVFNSIEVPIVLKFGIDTKPEVVAIFAKNPEVDAISISNTIHWYKLSEEYRLQTFGTVESPLAKYGGGGLSGTHLFPKVIDWIIKLRSCGYKKPINAGGGILSLADAEMMLKSAGDNGSISLGSIAFLRPWRVRNIIKTINNTC